MPRRVSPGASWRPPMAADQNAWSEAAEDYQRRRATGRGIREAHFVRHDRIKLQNSSGANIVAGEVLAIGDLLTDDVLPDRFWCDGTTPTDVDIPYAVARRALLDDELGDFIVAGICLARVNVTNTSHQYATLVKNDRVLDSNDIGTIRILNTLSSTGEQDCLVQLGPAVKQPLVRFTLNAVLATTEASETATITHQYGPGMKADTGASITVHNLLTHTAGTYTFEGDSGDAGWARWHKATDYIIINMECP